jgi:hypothetical protein
MPPLAAAIVEPVRVGPDLSTGDADKGADANEDGKSKTYLYYFSRTAGQSKARAPTTAGR